MKPSSREEAFRLLRTVGAPARLQRHVELVGEALDSLIAGLAAAGIPLNANFARVGVVVHDIGKTLHPSELDVPGSAHEAAGEQLLLEHGASADIARVARTHAAWRDSGVTFEELVIALADKLWKGARVAELEELVIARAAEVTATDRWSLFTTLDALFEEVATAADDRLARSAAPSGAHR